MMDERIKQLNHLTDAVAKQMLQSVVDKKQKFDKANEKEKRVRWLLIGCLGLICIYLLFSFQQLSLVTYRSVISFVLSSFYHLIIILIIFSLYYYLLEIRKKSEKAEKEFHDLRCEIIQKSADLWRGAEAWRERQHVFSMMKKEFDVNLYYENK
jgi:uncharacterized membrane protein